MAPQTRHDIRLGTIISVVSCVVGLLGLFAGAATSFFVAGQWKGNSDETLKDLKPRVVAIEEAIGAIKQDLSSVRTSVTHIREDMRRGQ